jgi:hypothetical protein
MEQYFLFRPVEAEGLVCLVSLIAEEGILFGSLDKGRVDIKRGC